MPPTNSQGLGFNYRGRAWDDGEPISRIPLPDNSEAEAQASLLYVWDTNSSSFVKVPGDATNGIKVQPQSPSVPGSSLVRVATAGTRVALSGSSLPIQSATVKALVSNAGAVYVGGSTVAISNGFSLAPGDTLSFDLLDLSSVWIDSDSNGDGVSIFRVS